VIDKKEPYLIKAVPASEQRIATIPLITSITKPTCGTKAIHKLIDRAFYSIANQAADSVLRAIKTEFYDRNGDKQIDRDYIIKKIDGNVIHWQSENMTAPKPITLKRLKIMLKG